MHSPLAVLSCWPAGTDCEQTVSPRDLMLYSRLIEVVESDGDPDSAQHEQEKEQTGVPPAGGYEAGFGAIVVARNAAYDL